jgi:hypothetical protein
MQGLIGVTGTALCIVQQPERQPLDLQHSLIKTSQNPGHAQTARAFKAITNHAEHSRATAAPDTILSILS